MKHIVIIFSVALIAATCFLARSAEKGIIILSDDNTVVINTPIDDNSARDVQLALMDKSKRMPASKPIYLFLNTPGGSIPAGFDIIETAKGLPNKVHTISKFSASMGFVISQFLDTRYTLHSATLMAHRARISGLSGEVPGSAYSRLNSLLQIVQRSDNQTAKRANMTVNAFQALIADELWLDSFTAVAMRFSDERVNVRCDNSLSGTYSKTIDLLFASVDVEFSKCPLVEAPVSVKLSNSIFGMQRDMVQAMLYDRARYYNDYIKTGLHK